MKLRNKKTGEIVDLRDGTINTDIDGENIIVFSSMHPGKYQESKYASLSELNEEWEDYTPVEPIIKDEKIRNAVRAWAEAVAIRQCKYDGFWKGFRYEEYSISFSYKFTPNFGKLTDGMTYTIYELCGGRMKNEQPRR